MYLKYLYVDGFKSFPEQSGLELDPGVCVFVGANGTGKSNLTDAVAWVLGEDDLPALRCRTASELVFAGSETLLPQKEARVTAVLDPRPDRSRANGLSIDACKHGHAAEHTDEIPPGALTITRTRRADGTDVFSLDGEPVDRARLRKTLDEAGVPFPPTTVIRQGALERLLYVDPETRRRIIETAAGIPDLRRSHDASRDHLLATRLETEHARGERAEALDHLTWLEAAVADLQRVRRSERRLELLRARAVVATIRSLAPTAPSVDETDLATRTATLLDALGLPPTTETSVGDAAGARSGSHAEAPGDVGAEIARVAAELAREPEVNRRAEADLEDARARLASSEDRLRHTDERLASLAAETAALSDRIADVFRSAHGRIEERFRRYYKTLAPDGQAELPIGDEGGVDVRVRPPGKVLDNVDALSGGERSLAALALALAVFEENRAPFFVLDEVEPALDDANTRRLRSVLHAVADGRQLLVVSHQQRAKETGDVVFGVERNLDGASQVKYRFEPSTRRLDIFRRTWSRQAARRHDDGHGASAPGLAADAPHHTEVSAGGSPTQATLLGIRGPRSKVTNLRPRPDGPWEGIWESLGNPDSTGRGRSEPEETDGDDGRARASAGSSAGTGADEARDRTYC